nr:nucleotide pyrophosphohydrolase [Bordetella petrii]
MQLTVQRSIIHSSDLNREKQEMEQVIQRLRQFRDERNWQQFHNPKDLALALSIEAGELLEVFLWKTPEAANPEKVKEELADVLAYALLLSDAYNFDIEKIILEKIERNEEKYPVHKAKGTAKKYNEL